MPDFWSLFILNPFANALLYLYTLVGNNFIIAIALFTVIIRLATVPTTLASQKNQQKMQELQPKIKEIQDKYKDNPEKMNAELAAIGFSPMTMMGGCLPMLIQFPFLIGLYQSITRVMAVSPLALVDLYHSIYPFFPNVAKLVPVNSHFLWLNLALPDPFLVLPALVFASTFISQKAITPAAPPATGGGDNQTAQMTQSMGITMAVMFGFMSLQFASGLSIYFIVSNLISMVQYPLSNPAQRQRLLARLRGEKLPELNSGKKSSSKAVVNNKPSKNNGSKPVKADAKKVQ
jgi:YidC/Oxa1 family membrane protein insertase